MKKLIPGTNDLKTLFPEVAAEADGWNPSTISGASRKERTWKCQKGHLWEARVQNRTLGNNGCPICSNQKILIGFNDLQTKFPEVAAEADGWDPSTVIAGSGKKLSWKCKEGHRWNTSPDQRTGKGKTGCPICAEFGYDPKKSGWFYLMQRKNEQQFGITNHIEDRINFHSKKGWKELKRTGPHDGYEVQETEKRLKQWLKKKIGVVEGTTENWYTSKMEVHSLAELKEKSGIKTTIF